MIDAKTINLQLLLNSMDCFSFSFSDQEVFYFQFYFGSSN